MKTDQLMSRAGTLESDLFESLRSRSILVRHGMHSFTKTHCEMLKSLYPEEDAELDGHIWDLIASFLSEECSIVHSKMQAERSRLLVPLLENAVAANVRNRTPPRTGLGVIRRIVHDCVDFDQAAFTGSAGRHRALYDAVNLEIERLTGRLRDRASETPAFNGKVGPAGLEVQLNEASEMVAIESRLALWNRLRGMMVTLCRFPVARA